MPVIATILYVVGIHLDIRIMDKHESPKFLLREFMIGYNGYQTILSMYMTFFYVLRRARGWFLAICRAGPFPCSWRQTEAASWRRDCGGGRPEGRVQVTPSRPCDRRLPWRGEEFGLGHHASCLYSQKASGQVLVR